MSDNNQAPKFEREERYIVVKLSRIGDDEKEALRDLLASYQIPTEECAVVEHDWPIYEEPGRTSSG